MNTCKNCKYWGGQPHWVRNMDINIQTCDMTDRIIVGDKALIVEAYASDDSGLSTAMMTGSNFSCIHFTEKK